MKVLSHYKVLLIFLALIASMPTIAIAKNQSVETASLFDLPLTELMNVEITTAGKTSEKVKDIPASVVVVTRSDIERYGYTTLVDVLENVPGLYNMYTYNGAPGNFGVRGFWNPYSQNSNIAILVNGVKQIDDDSASTTMAKITLPVEAIDRIEVIKGPMSVIYGSGASFGVINIITNEINKGNSNDLVSVTYGSRDTRKVAVRVSKDSGDLKLVVNASTYKTDGLDNKFSDLMSPANQAALPFFGVNNPNYSTDGLLEHENEYLGISGSYKKLYFDAAIQNTDIDVYAVSPSLRSGNERSLNNYSLMLGYKDNINDWISYDTNFAYFNEDDNDVFDFLDPNAFGTRDAEYNAWEAEFSTTIKPNAQWNIVAGLNQRTMNDNRENFDTPITQGNLKRNFSRDNRATQAIFTQATYTPNEKLTLVAGLRWENNPSYSYTQLDDIGTPAETFIQERVAASDDFLPRVAAIYRLDNINTLKFLYGEASKIVNDNTNVPETTKTYEINYIYNKDRNYISVSIFRNELDDLFAQNVIALPSGGLDFISNRDGQIKTDGIELISQSYLTENLLAELNYTYQQTDDIENNIDAPYSPNSLIQTKLSYSKELSTYSLLGRYTSSMSPITNLADTIGGYAVFDINYRRDKVVGNAYLNINLTNIFDEEIRYPTNPVLNPFPAGTFDRGTIGPERSIYGTLGWKF